MKINQLKLSALLSFFLLSPCCANAQTISNATDLSTDAGVIAELQKRVDAKNAKRANGDEKLIAGQKAEGKLRKEDVCIKRLKESKKVIVIGFSRTDVGCHFDGAFVDSRYIEREDAALSKSALAALGWEKADRLMREDLAKIWIGEGLLAFSSIPYKNVSAVTADEEIKIFVSSQYPEGVTSRSVPRIFFLDKNGDLLSAGDY